MPRILFILKHRDAPWSHDHYYGHLSSGLWNSVCFLIQLLELLGIVCRMVEVIDNNGIDAQVKAFKPTHVIIEAFWVVASKFDVLKKLHPHVTWMVRDHSETPFLANEGSAFGMVAGYLQRGVELIVNSPRALTDMEAFAQSIGHGGLVSYGPNYYPVHEPPNWQHLKPHPGRADDTVKVGCFGAIRPLKNHMVQAVAAIRFAAQLGKKLEFHINGTRVEGGGNPILNNLRAMFAATQRAKLVEHDWLAHPAFLLLLRTMDMVLQVSFSETFNIVSADAVSQSCPVVASKEVVWLQAYAIAEASSSDSILTRMLQVQRQVPADRLAWQWRDLTKYCQTSKTIWQHRFA